MAADTLARIAAVVTAIVCAFGMAVASAQGAMASAKREVRHDLADLEHVPIVVVVSSGIAGSDTLKIAAEIHATIVQRFAGRGITVPGWSPAVTSDDPHLAILAEAHRVPHCDQVFVEIGVTYRDRVVLSRVPRLKIDLVPIWQWEHGQFVAADREEGALRATAIRAASYFADEVALASRSRGEPGSTPPR